MDPFAACEKPFEQRLTRFYRLYAPDKIPRIETVLQAYAGREQQLMNVLVQKYGPEPPEEDPPEDPTSPRLHKEESQLVSGLGSLIQFCDVKHRALLKNSEDHLCVSCGSVLRPSMWYQCNTCLAGSYCARCCSKHGFHEFTYMGILALAPGSVVSVYDKASSSSYTGRVQQVDFSTFTVAVVRTGKEFATRVMFDYVTLLDGEEAILSLSKKTTTGDDDDQDVELSEFHGEASTNAYPPPVNKRSLDSPEATHNVFLHKYRLPLSAAALIGLALILVLVPLSFQYVPRQQFGLKKDTKTNSVDLTQVYTNGQYFWGLGFSPVLFPSTLISVSLVGSGNDIDVFTDSGQTVSIGVIFRYRLNQSLLGKLYTEFGTNYAGRVSGVAVAAMRNAVTNFSVPDYTSSRQNISDTLFNAVKLQVEGSAFVSIQRQHFSLQYITLPDIVTQQKVNVFEQTQVQQTNAYAYTANLYRLATTQMVTALNNNATLVTTLAQLTAARLLAQANARAFQAIQTETGYQLAAMSQALGVSQNLVADLNLLSGLLDLSDQSNVTLLHGISSALVSPSSQ